MSVSTQLVHPVADAWAETEAATAQTTLEQVLFASHLLGSNRALANYGGGNTSAKGSVTDHTGREIAAIWVKGSGSDLATMGDRDFTPLKLDEVLALLEREEMSDEEMVAYLARCQIEPAAPRSSIETLLHAFIPAAHVHHTHPDAINVMAGAHGGRELVAECFGDEAAWVDYIRPGFTLAKQVGTAVRENPDLKLVVLAKHGLVVWGDSAAEAYARTVEVCNQAAEFVNARTSGQVRFGGADATGPLTAGERRDVLLGILPALRGAVSRDGTAKILVSDLSPSVLELVDSVDGPTLTQVGAACPDHLVHTKRLPLWVAYDPATEDLAALEERIGESVGRYREDYAAYFAEHAGTDEMADAGTDEMADPNPRVVLIQHVGLVAVGPNVKRAKISRDLYHRAIEVMAGAHALSRFVSLTAAESFAIEYWPLELYKLAQLPPARELEGRVAFVTGAAGGIGRATMSALAAAGAAVVGFDIDADGAAAAVGLYGENGVAAPGDVTDEGSVAAAFATAVGAFGGIDIVVSNAGIASSASIGETTLAEWNRNQSILGTGYFLVGREAFRILESQATGGSVVFVASKNAIVAGPNAAAYSSAKALELHLARCLAAEGGAQGIRVNTVNPDAVLRGSKIWQGGWRAERAQAYGLDADQLEEHYRQRTVLGVNILPEDIAEAILHFASERRSGKSTGNILNVDGGVVAAFSR